MDVSLLPNEALALVGPAAKTFLSALPVIALSVVLAVWARRSGIAEKIRAKISSRPIVAIVMATVAGALSPFCSCGVVPIIASLLGAGVPLAPVMAFWLASPSMDPEIFLLSGSVLGWELAWWRLAATFAMSLGGGLITHALSKGRFFSDGILRSAGESRPARRPALALANASSGVSLAPLATSEARLGMLRSVDALEPSSSGSSGSCGCSASAPQASGEGALPRRERSSRFSGVAAELGRDLARMSAALGIAFLMEAAIARYVPQAAIAYALGGDSPFAVPLATLVGIPMYLSNISALGISSGLLSLGMSGGAALAFLIGGATTTVPAMAAVAGTVRPKVFAAYLCFAVAGALLAGYAFELAGALF
jgi:hypothetical protein